MESLRGLSSSPASAYDELVTGQKSIRYHWQGILSVIRSLPGGLGERVESARRQLEESGATVNLLDDRGAPRWTFDPLPFVVSPDEWSELETGLNDLTRKSVQLSMERSEVRDRLAVVVKNIDFTPKAR